MIKKLSLILLTILFFYSSFEIVAAKEKDDKGPLSKITFIHYRKPKAKPDGVGKPTKNTSAVCYGNFGKGIIWKTLPQSVVINTTNPDSLDQNQVKGAISASLNEWNSRSLIQLYESYSVDNGVSFDGNSLDGKNAMGFGNYGQSGVIAVTTVWGYFGGPPQTRGIVEFDIMFDTDFHWGVNEEENLMDLANIATHEIGHGWGMADIYDASCDQVTMYGYSTEGETIKRTLEEPDIKGLQSLYF